MPTSSRPTVTSLAQPGGKSSARPTRCRTWLDPAVVASTLTAASENPVAEGLGGVVDEDPLADRLGDLARDVHGVVAVPVGVVAREDKRPLGPHHVQQLRDLRL